MNAENVIREFLKTRQNFIFLGEAGCGKSEMALNFALTVRRLTDRDVHFFDLDQTKPLFRSRDVRMQMEAENVVLHYEEQFQDAPTSAGGVNEKLADPETITILDVGGSDTGSRLIGEYSGWLNRPETQAFFLLNVFRPWSRDIGAVDQTMTMIYRAARIGLENTTVILNPNVGNTTTPEEILEGAEKSSAMLKGILPVSMLAVRKEAAEYVMQNTDLPVFPLQMFMNYEWE